MTNQLKCSLGPRPDALDLVRGVDLKGQHAIVTGGASGIGVETVRALAVAGASITVPARNLAQAEEAMGRLRAETGNAAINVEEMDLMSLASVRAFAQRFLAKQPALHLLINNAGIMACPQERTLDGFERQLGTNHLGHFLLSVLLLPALKRAAPSRVVALSSSGHQWSDIDFDDLQFERRPYDKMVAYGQSKTANALFAVEFNRRYAPEGITANAVMPGAIATSLGRYMDAADVFWLDADGQLKPEFAANFKTPQQGAATTVWAAVGPEFAGIGGLYLEDCAVAETFDPAKAPKGVMPYAQDVARAGRLWDLSLRLVGLGDKDQETPMNPSFSDSFEAFHQMASQATGLSDFGPDNYQVGMRILLKSLDDKPDLTELGRSTFQQIVVGWLCGRLMTQQGLKSNPALLDDPIAEPLVIMGLPRTGTTVLHRLMAVDGQLQSLPFWLSNVPMARPPRDSWESHPAYQQVAAGLAAMKADNPGIADIHPMFAEAADECRWSLDQSFWANTVGFALSLPGYNEWVMTADPTYAYEYHRNVLRVVANGDRRRWVLKDPGHIAALPSLMKVFAGARVIFTHRDPVDALCSTISLNWAATRTRESGWTKQQVAQRALKVWTAKLNEAELARRRLPASQFVDVHMLECKRNPLATIRRVYGTFGLPISEATLAAWQQELATDPDQGHGAHRYTLEEFGIDRDQVQALICDEYHERYREVLATL